MFKVNFRGTKICFYFGFFAMLMFYFYIGGGDSIGITAALVSCLLHECGHLTAMLIFEQAPEKLCFYAGGIKIVPRHTAVSRLEHTIVLSAGCAVNLIVAAVSHIIGLEELSRINLALALINLMPFGSLDGGRLMQMYLGEGARKFIAISAAVITAAMLISAGGMSFSVIIFLFFIAAAEILMQ